MWSFQPSPPWLRILPIASAVPWVGRAEGGVWRTGAVNHRWGDPSPSVFGRCHPLNKIPILFVFYYCLCSCYSRFILLIDAHFYILTADLPLDDLVKEYEGAYDENFHWPHVFNQNEEGRKSSQGMYINVFNHTSFIEGDF